MALPPVTLLGAGLMGRLLGCALAERGHPVQVFDAGGPGRQGLTDQAGSSAAGR